MPPSNKRQIGFYADDDVEEYLDSLELGTKTKIINEAIRAWSQNENDEPLLIDRIEAIEKRLNRLERKK